MQRLFILCAACFFMLFQAHAISPNPDSIIIELKPGIPKNPPIRPRQVISEDIVAVYQNGILYFSTALDIEDALITITNTTSGELSIESSDNLNTLSVGIVGSVGLYEITIETDDQNYYGTFELI